MQRWEYLFVEQRMAAKGHSWFKNGEVDQSLTDKPPYEVMNILGGEGWELASLALGYYFKRPA